MAVYITAVHMVGGTGHEHIAEVRWLQDDRSNQSATAVMVDFIDKKLDTVWVNDGTETVQVGVVRTSGRAPYLRTFKDGVWKDNLLALPRY